MRVESIEKEEDRTKSQQQQQLWFRNWIRTEKLICSFLCSWNETAHTRNNDVGIFSNWRWTLTRTHKKKEKKKKKKTTMKMKMKKKKKKKKLTYF